MILPLTVMRRLDCVLEPKKEAVLEKAKSLPKKADEAMYRSDWGRCCFARYLIRLRPDLNPSFFELRHSNPYLLGRDRSFNDSSNYSECERGAVWKSSDSPLPEQRAIAALLERNTAQIDAVVAKKRRLIQRLQEKRQALISHAVTKGLDPHAPMKDSGVEWLSLVPKHWVLVSLKYVALIQSGLTLGKKHGEQPLISRPYLRVANVQDGYLDLDEITTVDLPQDDALSYELHAGDVLMTEGGDFDKLGRGYVWEG